MRRLRIPLGLAGLLVCSHWGAAATVGPRPGPKRPERPLRPARVAPLVLPTARLRFVSDNTTFALRLYQQLRTKPGNLVFSPYSISTALAMTYAGAAGETKRQMARALEFYLPESQLQPAFADLQRLLAARGQAAPRPGEEPFQLSIANALWGQQGHRFLPSYLRSMEMYYGGSLQTVDFRANPERARGTINTWVSQHTAGKIADLLPPGLLNPQTRLVLTNAVYFKAAWQHPFSANATSPGPSTTLAGQHITTEMMRDTFSMRYARGPDYEAVELPYSDPDFALLILVPNAGQFARVESSLTAARLNGVVRSLRTARVALTMPKFRYTSPFSLSGTLEAMGMRDAFEAKRADFSRMDGARDLFIQAVVHKAFIAVDEKGTEAAAATGVAMGITSAAPGQVITLTIDRPFIYALREQRTGTVLFLGRVADPRG